MSYRRSFATLFGTIALVLSTASVQAAPATPPASSADIPRPSECRVKPVRLLTLLELVDNLAQDSSQPRDQPTVRLASIKSGPPVSADDLAGITQTTRLMVACINARDPLRLAGLLSERFQARLAVDLLSVKGDVKAILDQLPVLSNEVNPNQDLAMIPIEKGWYPRPPDKDILAILTPTVEGLKNQKSFLVAFTYTDHRWKIDNVAVIEQPS